MAKKRPDPNNPQGNRGFRKGSGEAADWGTVDAQIIRAAIFAASNTGGAVRFGYSADGGAYAVGIYGDGVPYTEFIKPADDPEAFLEELTTYFEKLRSTPTSTGRP